jgi:mono/diheme cytochrome c family protein
VVIALTTGQMVGLAIVALLFIAFALASSFYFPRKDPNFPGDRLRLFVVVTIAFVVAMVGAMYVLAHEAEEEAEPGQATETVGGPSETQPPAGGGAEGEEGDPEAGAQVFAEGGCGGCHTLDAAGTAGTVGPNLDEAQPAFQEAVEVITNGRGAMPAFGGQLSPEQIRDVSAFIVESTG